MIDSRGFQDAESLRSGNSHVTNQLVSFTRHPIPGGMLNSCLGMSSAKMGRQTPTGKNENQTQDQDQRCQSGQSATDSVIIHHTSRVSLLEDKIQD